MQTYAWRIKAYNFCKLGIGLYCDIITFNMFSQDIFSVSANKFQLTNGSCHNSFIIDNTFYEDLLVDPPMQFTQIFQECYMNTWDALYNAVGIAQGNVSIQVPFFVFAVLPIFYLLLLCCDQLPPKEEYADQEKQDAIEILSLQLLRLRDGKTRGMKKKGILTKLAGELIHAAKQSGGYPDSDDEDDDDDDDDDDNDSISNPLHKVYHNKSKYNEKNRDSLGGGGTKKHSKGHKMGVFTKHLEEADSDRDSTWGIRLSDIGLNLPESNKRKNRKLKKSYALSLGIKKTEKQAVKNLYVLNSLDTNADAAEDTQILFELLVLLLLLLLYIY
jgi:hypothetical protein